MRVLIIGSGGREHALAWKLSQSPRLTELYCAPGNGGMAGIAECVPIKADDIAALLAFAKERKIDLTVVGPEAPLVAGIVDIFEEAGLMIFGPNRAAAQLEGSKVFAKEFMHRNGIPTASFMSFDTIDEARDFLQTTQFPLVIKADGLAGGKGVFVCFSLDEAAHGLNEIEQHMREAGRRIIIEECLQGEEASILAISDGERYVVLESSQDHKRIFDDDLGPNTGGMGAYSPAPVVNDLMLAKIESQVIEPTIRGMFLEKMPFKGVLYAGLMMTDEGPFVLEYNVRFGDPETQVVLPRLKNDLLEVLVAACQGRIGTVDLEWDPRSCVSVVMTAGGYPGRYETGAEISGLGAVRGSDGEMVFHAGTLRKGDAILTAGGRVLNITALGDGIEEAIQRAYGLVERISFDHCFFRRDIGAKAVRRLHNEAR